MVGATSTDATWQEMEKSLSESQCAAAAGQFAVSIMHEINNPIEAVANLNYLLRMRADDADAVREYGRLIEEQVTLVVQIARQTLSFYSPLDTVEEVGVASLADAALRVQAKRISSKRIRLIRNLKSDAVVRVHAGEMLQVMSNLIANAVDALPENGTLCLRARRSEKEVHITIADDGHGIPQAIQRKIFDPFFTTKKGKGTGLGLSISKAIVERHRGRIRSWSSIRSGRSGTAFRISLPLERSSFARG